MNNFVELRQSIDRSKALGMRCFIFEKITEAEDRHPMQATGVKFP